MSGERGMGGMAGYGERRVYGRGGRATEDERSRRVGAGYALGSGEIGRYGRGWPGYEDPAEGIRAGASNFQNALQNGVAHFGGRS